MQQIARFGVSLDRTLLESFDHMIQKKNYTNRSEAIRDLIRDFLVEEEWAEDKEVVGSITIVYDHHVRELSGTLTDLQHRVHSRIISSLHVHLDESNCLEVLVLRGKARDLKALADKLIATRGVKHGQLVMTTSGKHLK